MKETRSELVKRVVRENRQHDDDIADDLELYAVIGEHCKGWLWMEEEERLDASQTKA